MYHVSLCLLGKHRLLALSSTHSLSLSLCPTYRTSLFLDLLTLSPTHESERPASEHASYHTRKNSQYSQVDCLPHTTVRYLNTLANSKPLPFFGHGGHTTTDHFQLRVTANARKPLSVYSSSNLAFVPTYNVSVLCWLSLETKNSYAKRKGRRIEEKKGK